MLQKDDYPYEYEDSWERFNEMSLPTKKAFCSNLTIESITDIDYKHAKRRVWVDFVLQDLGQYHDLYLQDDTLLRNQKFQK